MKRKQIEVTGVDHSNQRISVEIDHRAVCDIDRIADANKVSRSEVLRDALYWWLAYVQDEKKGYWIISRQRSYVEKPCRSLEESIAPAIKLIREIEAKIIR